MLSHRVVENFFKRARFRRSKRLRSSIRSSLIKKETRMSASAEDDKREKCGSEPQAKDSIKQSSSMSASALDASGKSNEPSVSASLQLHVLQKTIRPKATCGISNVASSTEMTSTASAATMHNDPDCSSSFRPESLLLSSQPSSSHLPDQPLSIPLLSNQLSLGQQPKSSLSSLSIQPSLSEPSLSQPAAVSDSTVVEVLKTEVERLKKELSMSQEMLIKMQEREKQLRNRLSEQAQRQLLKGSSKFEDLSLGESRPTQLIKRYGNLYTESRLDALDALDDVPNMAECEDLKIKLLLSVIVLAFRSAEKTLNETKNKIRELLHIPRVIEGGNSSLCHAAKEVEGAVAFYLRRTVDRHDISKNYKEVCDRVWTTLFDYPMLQECQGLLRYIDDCVRIAWAITVQNPPFVIDYESKTFNSDLHTRFHTSDSESPLIKSVLWPMLLEGEGGACVSKGIVLT